MKAERTTLQTTAVVVLGATLLLVLSALWLGAVAGLYFVVPQMKDAAADSGRMVSSTEILLIRASDLFVNYLYVGVPLLLGGLLLTATGVVRLMKSLLGHAPQSSSR